MRQFHSRDSEMKAAANSQTNLANIARDLSTAQKKAEKAKGSRKEGGANTTIDDAARQWESQAPFIYEQLQAVDERRVNHLRDVLTQLQTHEADQVERNRASAESCLNALLNLETADEIRTFAEMASLTRSSTRRSSVIASRPNTSSMLAPPEPPPSRQPAMPRRLSSTSGQDRGAESTPTKSKLGGLKRLGTVMSRKKSMDPPPTPEKKKDRRSMMPFRRGDSSRSFQDLEESGRDLTPAASREQNFATPQQTTMAASRENLATQAIPESPVATQVNGNSEYQPPPGPPPGHISTGPSLGQPATEPIIPPIATQSQPAAELPVASSPVTESYLPPALQPQNTGTESEEGSRAFAIRDQPIKEDESEAQLAMSNMASQLRMQGQTSGINRVQTSVRGRRDVRNTMFIPAGVDVLALGAQQHGAPQSPPIPESNSTTDLASPIQAPRQKAIHEDHQLGSETGSVHSSHSLAALAHHPELHEPGLNASVVETVHSSFSESGITKSVVTGEVALSYNPSPSSTAPETETIRLSHFELLEKVAANPTFVTSAPRNTDSSSSAEDSAGIYTIGLSNIRRPSPTVGLKYQLHLEPSNLAAYSPLLLTPAWQLVEGQASVIVLYSLNPSFVSATDPSAPVVFKNVAISVSLDVSGADAIRPSAAVMAPTAGASFKRKAGTVTWRFNELSVKSEGQERLLVRFSTGAGLPRRGGVEVKFELPGRMGGAVGVERRVIGGSGGAVGRERDPFADDDAASANAVVEGGQGGWVDVNVRKLLVSGRYTAA